MTRHCDSYLDLRDRGRFQSSLSFILRLSSVLLSCAQARCCREINAITHVLSIHIILWCALFAVERVWIWLENASIRVQLNEGITMIVNLTVIVVSLDLSYHTCSVMCPTH